MTDDNLRLNIESLGRLTGTLRTIKDELKVEPQPTPPEPGTVEPPSATAARSLAAGKIPSLNDDFRKRLEEVASLLDNVREKFRAADEVHPSPKSPVGTAIGAGIGATVGGELGGRFGKWVGGLSH